MAARPREIKYFSASPHKVCLHAKGDPSSIVVTADVLPADMKSVFDAVEDHVKLMDMYDIYPGIQSLGPPEYSPKPEVHPDMKAKFAELVGDACVVIFVSGVTRDALAHFFSTDGGRFIDPDEVATYLGLPKGSVILVIPYSGRDDSLVRRDEMGRIISIGAVHWVTSPRPL